MDKAIELIKHFEGLHDGNLQAIGLQPKMCPAGVWTVGYGHAIVDPATGKMLRGEANRKRALELFPALTVQQAEQLLASDYAIREAQVAELLKFKPTANELGAMTSLAYNIGIANFRNSSVLRFYNTRQKDKAADSFLLWVNAGGKTLPGLQLRRMAERHLFLHDELKFFSKSAIQQFFNKK